MNPESEHNSKKKKKYFKKQQIFPDFGNLLLLYVIEIMIMLFFHSEANPYIYLFYPQGLDADMKYEDTATGKVYTGAALMKAGLPLPLTTGDYQPIRFTFKAVEK